jgi:peptide/nickel transport system ATP-binding protein/oligopeptide transport system ATP-binding protein
VNGKRREIILKAVDDLTFDIYEGESLGIVGESGSGKSTLGRCILRLTGATFGEVIYGGRDVTKISNQEMKKLRADMQMVFQNPRSSFNPKIQIRRALRNVAKFYGMETADAKARVAELFEMTNLGSDILSHRSDELSGGQLQRLALVRALIPSPKFILADEAVSALDVSVQAQILNLFGDLKERYGLTLMFISHDLTVVEYLCDRVIVLYLGAAMETATADDLFRDPKHPYTKLLIAAKPKTFPEEEKLYIPPEGEIPSAVDIPEGCRFCTRCPDKIEGVCDTESPKPKEVSSGHFVACHLYQDINMI